MRLAWLPTMRADASQRRAQDSGCSVYGLRSLAAVASRSPLTTALILDNIVLLRSTRSRVYWLTGCSSRCSILYSGDQPSYSSVPSRCRQLASARLTRTRLARHSMWLLMQSITGFLSHPTPDRPRASSPAHHYGCTRSRAPQLDPLLSDWTPSSPGCGPGPPADGLLPVFSVAGRPLTTYRVCRPCCLPWTEPA